MQAQQDLDSLLDKYGNMILRLAYTYLKSRADAEDVLQDVFVRVCEKNPEFNSDEHTRAWLVRTTVNLCKNRLGSFWSRNRRPIEDAENAAVFDSYNEGSPVIDAVFTLGKKYRVCVFLFYFEGYSTAETARIVGKSETALRSEGGQIRGAIWSDGECAYSVSSTDGLARDEMVKIIESVK